MKVHKIVKQTIQNVTSNMHVSRRSAFTACVVSILDGNPVSVTRIGRGISDNTLEKHKIKRADRLCSNRYLHKESFDIYQSIVSQFAQLNPTPIILVDWSDLDDRQDKFLLRATIALDGRAITIYQEAHTNKTKDKPTTHKLFLKRLKSMFDNNIKPIIVTDAGFRGPWFQQVKEIGWDFVGRVSNRTKYQLEDQLQWTPIKTLYPKATKGAKLIGAAQLAKSNPTPVNLVLVKKRSKGRHKLTRHGDISRWTNSKRAAQREREPWLLATSLANSSTLVKRTVKIYQSRMQIELTFRDTKNVYYGLGFSANRTKKLKRMCVLLLLSAIASLILVIIGLLAEKQAIHKDFQANTVSNRRVLSLHYLGLRIVQNGQYQLRNSNRKIIQKLFFAYMISYNESMF